MPCEIHCTAYVVNPGGHSGFKHQYKRPRPRVVTVWGDFGHSHREFSNTCLLYATLSCVCVCVCVFSHPPD